jgi:citrate lyase subunit beta/citryl-CoA lyase
MRSKLFVPGSSPELFAKALASDADALSLDLEDAVAAERKSEARTLVAQFLKSPEVLATTKVIIVRVNGRDSPHFAADVLAVANRRLDLLNLPKVESAEDVRAGVAALDHACTVNGFEPTLRVLANIETPRGLRRAAEIAAAHPRIAGLQLGYLDLFSPTGIERRDGANVHAAMFALRMACAEAGIFAYDGAYPDAQDDNGFRAEAEMARRLGFLGKSCIHPRQVPIANEMFRLSEKEIAHAQRVVDAAREAAAKGIGAFTVDGKMIDAPAVRRAHAVIEFGRHLRPVPAAK